MYCQTSIEPGPGRGREEGGLGRLPGGDDTQDVFLRRKRI